METVKELISKCGNFRIVISEDWNKTFTPDEDCFFDGIRMFVTRNRHFCPRCAETLQGYEGEVRDLKRDFGRTRVYPFSATVHSGVYLTFGVRNDWDSGIIGFLCIDSDKAKKSGVKFSKKYTKEKYLEEYVNDWNHYMNEPDYMFEVQEREELYNKKGELVSERWNHVDSCGGYQDMEDCIADAKANAKAEIEFED